MLIVYAISLFLFWLRLIDASIVSTFWCLSPLIFACWLKFLVFACLQSLLYPVMSAQRQKIHVTTGSARLVQFVSFFHACDTSLTFLLYGYSFSSYYWFLSSILMYPSWKLMSISSSMVLEVKKASGQWVMVECSWSYRKGPLDLCRTEHAYVSEHGSILWL